MSELIIADGANRIIQQLNNCGYKAFIAGGAVRDLIMGKTPHDYDIATSAPPSEIKKVFRHTIDTGIKHGTVTVVDNKTGYEVTTFRRDGSYADGRRPSSVEFMSDPKEDCRRRDFTINAMMYSPTSGILDFFGGENDIKRRIIRCVGEPERRFKEDALRMMRAIRFRAVLGFEIDKKTENAIKKCSVLIKKVSAERIRDELNKILLSEHPDYIRDLNRLGLLKYILPELDRCFGEPQRNKYHIYDVGEHIMHTVKNTAPDLMLRWAAVLHDTGKPCCPSTDSNGVIHFYGHHRESRRITVDVLYRLHMDSDFIKDVSLLVENHDYRVDANFTAVKRMMSKTGAELFEKLLMLQRADNMAKNPRYLPEKLKRIEIGLEIYREVIASHQPYRISDLVINGRDLMNIGYRQGREIGDALKLMLDEVIINPELNTRAYLMKRAKDLRRKNR
ncbi:MAG: CCA tRNA nucleotidyltransferase [Oscillospiraceae bacterium]|nr:CCA tRNA nucleotidyltransferase [Oscillospiraceae bacterium]